MYMNKELKTFNTNSDMSRIKTSLISVLLATLSVACTNEAPERYLGSLSGVWEGPMTVSGRDIHVKIMYIKGSSAELYDMKYTCDGYEMTDKKESSVTISKMKKNDPVQFQLLLGGKECEYFLDGSKICETEGESTFNRTSNTMEHYKNGTLTVPGMIPHDMEYTGPSKYAEKPMLSAPSLALDWTDLLLWVGEATVKSATSMAASEFLKFIFSGDSASATLDDVLSRIAEIKDMLNTMITLYHNSVYEGKLNERSKMQYEMHNHNYETFIRLKNASGEEQAREIIKSWAEKTVGGNPAYEQALNYMDFLTATVIEQKDIFNMYDLYTYNTTAWEHKGYDYREALRKSDIAATAEGLFLSQYYQMTRTDLDETSRKELLKKNADKFKDFSDFVKKHPVEHHDKMAICQIPGAHFAMERESISYPYFEDPSWCHLPARWTRYESDKFFMWGPNQAENYSQAISPGEMTKILAFYEGKKTVYEILRDEALCTMIPGTEPGSGKRAALCLQGSYYPGDWREIGLDSVILTSASYPYEIAPLSTGRAIIDGAGIFAQYLEFYKWDKYYNDILWIRTKVVER